MSSDKVVSEVFGTEVVLAPSDIVNREFHRSFLGYQPKEVDAYLSRVADVLENLIRETRDLKSEQEEMQTRLNEYRQVEETLRNALVTSQKFGENLIETAKREAETIVAAARLEQKRIETEATHLPAALTREITLLREQRNRLRAELGSLLDAHREMLEHLAPAEDALDTPFVLGLKESESPTQVIMPGVRSGEAVFPPLENEVDESETVS